MASSNDLARLVVKLEAQTAQYDATLKRVGRDLKRFRADTNTALSGIQKQFGDFGRNLARSFAIGSVTAALYGLTASIRQAVATGDELGNFAAKTGLSAKAVSELAYAAKIAEVDLKGLETGFKKMQVSVSQLGSGTKASVATFKALGLTFADLKDLEPDRQLELIADQIAKLEDPADRTRAAVELFGRAGADLLPLFEQGAEGIRRLRAETPHIFSEDALKRLSDADDAIQRLNTSLSGLAQSLATKIAPAISGFADALSSIINNKDFNALEKLLLLTSPGKLIQAVTSGSVATPTNSGPMGRVLPGLAPGDGGKKPPGFADVTKQLREIQPVVVTATRILTDYNAMLKATETDAQAAARAYELFKIQLQELDEAGRLGPGEFNKRLAEFQDQALPEFVVTAQKIAEPAERGFDLVTAAAQHAAENINDAFVGFFMSFGDGARDMAKSFIDALHRMVANLAASQLMNLIGGGLVGSSSPFLSALGSALTVPGLASGGPVSQGRPYMVGEEGPEMFVPGASGSIVPNGALGGSVQITQNIDARGATMELVKVLPGILERHGRETEARVVEGIRRNRYRLNPA